MKSTKTQHLLEQLIVEILMESKFYRESVLRDPARPWTIQEIRRGVQAVLATEGREVADGWNPDRHQALEDITELQGFDSTQGHHHMFSVLCEHIADRLSSI